MEQKNDLTKREKEILRLLIQGDSYKKIAEKYFINYATVNTHFSNIYRKLKVKSATAAVSKVLREEIINETYLTNDKN